MRHSILEHDVTDQLKGLHHKTSDEDGKVWSVGVRIEGVPAIDEMDADAMGEIDVTPVS